VTSRTITQTAIQIREAEALKLGTRASAAEGEALFEENREFT